MLTLIASPARRPAGRACSALFFFTNNNPNLTLTLTLRRGALTLTLNKATGETLVVEGKNFEFGRKFALYPWSTLHSSDPGTCFLPPKFTLCPWEEVGCQLALVESPNVFDFLRPSYQDKP